MRPGQNNRRMRGRSRGKGPNPLTRSYESNGPDVKVRGTAQHIAEKYGQLARDAQASGDPVAAENYFQHAEHYLRIIATAQESMRQQYGGGRSDDDGDEDDDTNAYGHGHGYGSGSGSSSGERTSQPQRAAREDVDPASQPQPPSFDPRPDRQGEHDYQPRGRGDRRERFQRATRQPESADGADAGDGRSDAPPQQADAPAREETTPRRGRRRAAPSVSEEAVEQASLPDFLTRPVPRATEDAAPAEEAEAKPKRRRAATTTTRRTTRKSAAAATEGEDNTSAEGDSGSDKTAAE